MIAIGNAQHQMKSQHAKPNPSVLALIELENRRPKYKFVREADLSSLSIKHRVLYRADLESDTLVNEQAANHRIKLPKSGVGSFLKGIEAAFNLKDVAEKETLDGSHQQHIQVDVRKPLRSIASRAMDRSTDHFFEQMENNIDRWTYDASSIMLNDVALQKDADYLDKRREAAEIQVKSHKFITEFRAFVVESLVEFKVNYENFASSKSSSLALVHSDICENQNIEPELTRQCEGQTMVEFSQLNRRLGAILNKKLDPEENLFCPKAIATSLTSALNECGYNAKQRSLLEPIIIDDFNQSLEKLYREINQIWIEMDILPEIKFEIVNSEITQSVSH